MISPPWKNLLTLRLEQIQIREYNRSHCWYTQKTKQVHERSDKTEAPDFAAILADFLDKAMMPNGWARWCTAVWTARKNQDGNQENSRNLLMQLLAIAPRPRSYKQWSARLLELEEMLGEAYCVSCCRPYPVKDLTHQESGSHLADVAGLLCPKCASRVNTGKVWPTSWKGLPILEEVWRYKEMRKENGYGCPAKAMGWHLTKYF